MIPPFHPLLQRWLLPFLQRYFFSSYRTSSVPDSRGTSGSGASASNGLPQDRRSCSEWTAKGSNSFKRNCIRSCPVYLPADRENRKIGKATGFLSFVSFPRVVGINFIRKNFQSTSPSSPSSPFRSLFLPFDRRFDFLRGHDLAGIGLL